MKAVFLQMQGKSVSWQPVEPMLDSAGVCCEYMSVLMKSVIVRPREANSA